MIPRQLDIASLRAAYRQGLKPSALIEALLERMAADDNAVWISRFSREALLAMAHKLDALAPERLPLYGIPFAIKDNIDVQGLATTAACPDYAYQPAEHAPVVATLIAMGAIPLGKTNLDQFATGLNGTRSPYGICRNAFNPDYIAGGSSSGSAVAVASGWASFSLGTDTAGSGRVPAAFNNLVGLKPTRGLLSTRGVVPACRTLDCVSIFSLTAGDARTVFDLLCQFDERDPYARKAGALPPRFADKLRVGVALPSQLQFFGDSDYAQLYAQACQRLGNMGASILPLDCRPLFEAATMLYQGPWIAERYLTLQALLDKKPEAILPVIRDIVGKGREPRATEVFSSFYRLQSLRREAEALWQQVDVMLMPTAGRIFRIDEMLAEPIVRNSELGYYTNFMNLLDFSAIAVPAGFRTDGLPFGITLFAPAGSDRALLDLASRWENSPAQNPEPR